MMSRKTLLIDAQLFQSLAYHRGMGKYSLALLEELSVAKDTYDKKVLVLNNSGIDPAELAHIREIARGMEIVFLDLKKTGPANFRIYDDIEQANRRTLDIYIEENFAAYDVDFLILSLFQDAECSTFPSGAKGRFMIIYDLIPVQFPEFYLLDPYAKTSYLSRYKVMYEVNHFFAISRTVANDLCIHLGVPAGSVTPIYGAQIKRKRIKARPVKAVEGTKYVLMPTGDDYRKNNRRAALAFNEFNRKHGATYRLVITSFFGDRTQKELKSYCEDIIFTGNVPEAELSWLYENAELVLFPSEYEGLGLPVMEAVEFGKPVVCSGIDVFKEIHDAAFTFCDPYDIQDIEAALSVALGREINQEFYQQILKKYSWKNTSDLLVERLENIVLPEDTTNKPKIAVFAPSPSGYSAIGKVVQEQHYVLSRNADVDYYLEEGLTDRAKQTHLRENFLPYVANVFSPWSFDEKSSKTYDRVIYHIGNSEYHVGSLVKALTYPDVAIFHDTDISGLYDVTVAFGLLSESRVAAEKNLQKLLSPKSGSSLVSLVSRLKKAIVHSDYAAEAVKNARVGEKQITVEKVNLPTPAPYYVYYKPLSREVVVALAGIVHEAKGINLVEQLSSLKLPDHDLQLKIFGFSLLDSEAEERLTQLHNVRLITGLSDTRFIHELVQSDIIINFRSNYHGETSLSTLEALRQGKAVIANNTGWFGELPVGIVDVVRSRSEIPEAIERIVAESSRGGGKGRSKSDYITGQHNIDDYVSAMLKDLL